jgi:hypothetical protein
MKKEMIGLTGDESIDYLRKLYEIHGNIPIMLWCGLYTTQTTLTGVIRYKLETTINEATDGRPVRRGGDES